MNQQVIILETRGFRDLMALGLGLRSEASHRKKAEEVLTLFDVKLEFHQEGSGSHDDYVRVALSSVDPGFTCTLVDVTIRAWPSRVVAYRGRSVEYGGPMKDRIQRRHIVQWTSFATMTQLFYYRQAVPKSK